MRSPTAVSPKATWLQKRKELAADVFFFGKIGRGGVDLNMATCRDKVESEPLHE
jgi:hypothetical protein